MLQHCPISKALQDRGWFALVLILELKCLEFKISKKFCWETIHGFSREVFMSLNASLCILCVQPCAKKTWISFEVDI
ncbi:hypothetical protein OUZ56_010354 [Daphnia magna]|uniref:Uncharacterized protein n=1 Tax=Daphnia magna TaxID=35525 RepID=A0ABR0AIA3_9CRUS|nr:hypothetical protein OUZ56_010354 [Daphnia magna]